MKSIVFSITLLAFVAHSCMAAIVVQPPESELSRLDRAVIDVLTSCYGDPGDTVGILGNVDGSILKTLWSKYFIPTVLIDNKLEVDKDDDIPLPPASKLHRLRVFLIVADSKKVLSRLCLRLSLSIWWNHNANILILQKNLAYKEINLYGVITFYFGMLNVQVIHPHRSLGAIIFTINPFTNKAPKHWTLLSSRKFEMICDAHIHIFARVYREGGQICKDLNFDKTIDIGGHPFYFIMERADLFLDKSAYNSLSPKIKEIYDNAHRKLHFMFDHIVIRLNATALIVEKPYEQCTGIQLQAYFFSYRPHLTKDETLRMIIPLTQDPLFAVTQHTGHMSQLEKILSVIDRKSRIGMWLVYLITFLFFKFFLRQTVVSALLNLVRLTCGTGLTKLPQNVSATIYLSCLFMFVVVLQGIYTGNLATLLTTTIAYRNVQTKQDIAYLDYKVYNEKNYNTKLTADPILDGRFIEIPDRDNCSMYILSDPLGVCVFDFPTALSEAFYKNLHVSKDAILHDYWYSLTTWNNPFHRRIDFLMKELTEHGLWKEDKILDNLHDEVVDDDAVKQNVERRVMTLDDLCFAFVILGVGLTCSIICFIGEIVIYRIRLKIAKRRNRVRVPIAWGVPKKKCSRFPSFNLRFNARRLLSIRG